MGAVSRYKAGVGSAVNDTTRLLSGTLGVAVIGSIYASAYSSRLAAGLPPRLPGQLTQIAHQSVGAALAVAGRLGSAGHQHAASTVHRAATHALIHGLSISCLVAGAVAAAGAVMASAFLPAQPPKAPLPGAPAAQAPAGAEPALRDQ